MSEDCALKIGHLLCNKNLRYSPVFLSEMLNILVVLV